MIWSWNPHHLAWLIWTSLPVLRLSQFHSLLTYLPIKLLCEPAISRSLSADPFFQFYFFWCRRPHVEVLWKFCALRECSPLMISLREELSFPHFPLRSQWWNRSTRSLISWEDVIKNTRASSAISSFLLPERCYLPPLLAVCIIDENKRVHNLCIIRLKLDPWSLTLQKPHLDPQFKILIKAFTWCADTGIALLTNYGITWN